MKKQIDIQMLLQWAFREELPKGLPVTATPWESISRFVALGVRIDTSGYGPSDAFGRVPGEPHEDAAAIGFQVKQLPGAVAIGAQHDAEGDARELLGHLYDLDPPAARTVTRSQFNMAAIVVHHAVMGSAPVWDLGSPMPSPCRRLSNGRPIVMGFDLEGELVMLEANGGRRGMIEPYNFWQAPRSQLQWCDPSIAMLAEARAEYTVWHAGLVRLAEALDGVLRDHVALTPAMPAAPWFEGAQPASRVLRAISADASAPEFLPLRPDREGESIARSKAQRASEVRARRKARRITAADAQATIATGSVKRPTKAAKLADCSPSP